MAYPQPTQLTRDAAPECDSMSPEKMIVGDPLTDLWIGFSDKTDQFHVGYWSSGICIFRVDFTENEMCFLLEGDVRLTDRDGIVSSYSKGACFVIPAGFVGTWESVTPVTKIFASFEAT